ncbi:MAG: transporter substrate-binding domain-containing protein [Gluconacetobacter diazotrophicus]|nr:transporter substrate-binding domain-containing protein [Gluconacetobacter diazotrophicus]
MELPDWSRSVRGAMFGGALLAALPFSYPARAQGPVQGAVQGPAQIPAQSNARPAGLPPAGPATAGSGAAAPGAAIPSGGTLEAVRKNGVLRCALVSDEDDYSEADTHGDLTALGADLCRALAAEVLGDGHRARFLVQPDEPAGLEAVRSGRADVLFGATPDPVTGAVKHLAFGPPVFFDGQGFLVRRELNVGSPAGLSGKNVCFINAAPSERTLYDGLEPTLATPERHFPYSERGEMNVALLDGHCDAVTADLSILANVRASFGNRAGGFSILDGTVSTDPFAPAVRDGDPAWLAIVDWTVWALVQAEQHGVTHANLLASRQGRDPAARRLAGEPWIARTLGLDDLAFARAIAAVGNYGEIYDRDVGRDSKLGLPRGRNQPAEQGGLLWALPVQPAQ